MVQFIDNETLIREAWPLARQVRPSTRSSVHVEIIGKLTPELPVRVLKFWSKGVMETMAVYYAVSAVSAEDALRKYIDYCEGLSMRGYFVSKADYELWAKVNPDRAGKFTEVGGYCFETAYFRVAEFTLREFVIEYCKVM